MSRTCVQASAGRFVPAVAAIVLAATSSVAEVRVLQPLHGLGAIELQVVPTARGPWSPIGGVDEAVLNPNGDVLGDGMPGHAVAAGRLIAAWVPGSTDGLRLAVSDGQAWLPMTRVEAPGVVGTPWIVPLGSGWLVAWHDRQRSFLVPLSASGEAGNVVEVAEGSPAELVVLDGAAHLALLDRSGGLSIHTVLFSIIPEIPEDILKRAPVELGRGTLALPTDRRVPASRPDEGAWVAEVVNVAHDRAVLAWWTGSRELNAVLLETSGVASAAVRVAAPGQGQGFPSSLLKRALRELGAE